MSAPQRLSTARIESARAIALDVWMSDNDGSRGNGRLLVRISPCGTRRFYFRGSRRGRTFIVPLGRYNRTSLEGYFTLEQARERARHYGALLHDGHVEYISGGRPVTAPPPTLQAVPAEVSPPTGTTLLDLCNAYVAFLSEKRSKSSAQCARLDVKNYVAPFPSGSKAANQVSQQDVMSLLRTVKERSSAKKTNRIRALLSAAYGLALQAPDNAGLSSSLLQFELSANPVSQTKKLEVSRKRLNRTLSGAELGRFWRLLTTIPRADTVKYKVVRVTILLGGQRCTQLLETRLCDVDVDSMTLMLFDSKGRRTDPREHLLPLTPLVWAEIKPLLQEAKALGQTFLFRGKKEGAHIGSDVISHAVEELSDTLLQAGEIKEPICYRDIRRTIETRMSDLEIDDEVRNQIQSHDMGGVQMTHYNRATFLPQKRRALEQWQRYVLERAAETSVAAVRGPTRQEEGSDR